MNGWSKIGSIGAGITALCCFTPLLVVLLPAIGLSAWLTGLDMVLFPVLAVFIVMIFAGMFLAKKKAALAGSTRAGDPS